MADRPPIDDPELLARLALDEDTFVTYVTDFYARIPTRQYGPATLARALEYPFARPRGSFHLQDLEVAALDEIPTRDREPLIERFAEAEDRHPVLAIGSNGSPSGLRNKFAHFDDPADREVLVLTGSLHDFDVGAQPQPALYGSLPATLFPSPGTRVRTALLWVTPAQLTQLAWSEVNYLLGTIRASFEVDHMAQAFDEVLVFVSRFGAFSPAGEPVALTAVSADGRTATALDQEALLDSAAAFAIGASARAEDLVRAIHADLPSLLPRLAGAVWPLTTPFESPRWTRFIPRG